MSKLQRSNGRFEPFQDLGIPVSGLQRDETAIVFCGCKGLPMISRNRPFASDIPKRDCQGRQCGQCELSLRMPAFYKGRGTVEQRIKQGMYALIWTRLSCMRFAANAARLQLHALVYNLANFRRTLAKPDLIERWSLTSLRERLIKSGARPVRHGLYAIFQMPQRPCPERFSPVSSA